MSAAAAPGKIGRQLAERGLRLQPQLLADSVAHEGEDKQVAVSCVRESR